jgi:hypothetical protein
MMKAKFHPLQSKHMKYFGKAIKGIEAFHKHHCLQKQLILSPAQIACR